jgi:hypothetical protein
MKPPSKQRRRFIVATLLAGFCTLQGAPAWAVSSTEAVSGLKEALTRGATQAVATLGKPDGFWGNEKVRIPLPEKAQQAEKLLRRLGGGKYVDQLVETMNRAAESAVVEAKPILWQSIKQMSVKDALGILQGGDDAATQYFRTTSTTTLAARVRPLVDAATRKVGVARQYEKFAGKASQLGLLDEKDADLNAYITGKTLDGLFLMIAEEEKAIRQDPVSTGSGMLKKVFGALLK